MNKFLIPLLLVVAACSQLPTDYSEFCAGESVVYQCQEYILVEGSERMIYLDGEAIDCSDDASAQCQDALHSSCEQVHTCEPSPEFDGFIDCEGPRPDFCTEQYDPVCAEVDTGIRCITEPCPSTEWKTYGNACSACADRQVYGYTPGACAADPDFPEEPSVSEKFSARCDAAPEWVREGDFLENFDCVSSCPEESYSTQIGLEVCIELLDKEYFESLPECSRSSDSCDCILPTSTTAGEEIDVGFRCVEHENYKNRMVHYGLTRLDEFGQQSTVIA